jgi:hypothetical protein
MPCTASEASLNGIEGTAALGQVPKRADATSSSGVEGLPAADACVLTGSLGPRAEKIRAPTSDPYPALMKLVY